MEKQKDRNDSRNPLVPLVFLLFFLFNLYPRLHVSTSHRRASTKLRLSFKASSRSRNLSNGPLILRLKVLKAFLSFCKLPIPVSPNPVPFSSFEACSTSKEREKEAKDRSSSTNWKGSRLKHSFNFSLSLCFQNFRSSFVRGKIEINVFPSKNHHKSSSSSTN